MARPALSIGVTQKDQNELTKLLRGGVQQVRVVLRALALLQLARGASAPRIAGIIPLTPQAIRKVGHRYQEGGLEPALYDKQRPGAAAVLDDSQKQPDHRHGVQRPARRPCPLDCASGGAGSCQAATGPTCGKRNHPGFAPPPRPQAVAGKKCGAWPNSTKSTSPRWKTSWRRMRNPTIPSKPVVCLDEKPVTLHADVRPASPAKPGREARRDNEYERRGTANVSFCAVEPKAGRHITFPTPDRSAFEFARVACELAMQYPVVETIHLVMGQSQHPLP